ncbi:hypothetical protein ANCCAN_06930 [Ancylostoma caninum]|uniref:Uncharacterized protein n=1 Tax=Ancylostoma caninum TaxID=29170 RepID=A0A368GUN0_ANCCA|nr:hypothetical protein ANCCAN_06930 [Ancylostoma caninum]
MTVRISTRQVDGMTGQVGRYAVNLVDQMVASLESAVATILAHAQIVSVRSSTNLICD